MKEQDQRSASASIPAKSRCCEMLQKNVRGTGKGDFSLGCTLSFWQESTPGCLRQQVPLDEENFND